MLIDPTMQYARLDSRCANCINTKVVMTQCARCISVVALMSGLGFCGQPVAPYSQRRPLLREISGAVERSQRPRWLAIAYSNGLNSNSDGFHRPLHGTNSKCYRETL